MSALNVGTYSHQQTDYVVIDLGEEMIPLVCKPRKKTLEALVATDEDREEWYRIAKLWLYQKKRAFPALLKLPAAKATDPLKFYSLKKPQTKSAINTDITTVQRTIETSPAAVYIPEDTSDSVTASPPPDPATASPADPAIEEAQAPPSADHVARVIETVVETKRRHKSFEDPEKVAELLRRKATPSRKGTIVVHSSSPQDAPPSLAPDGSNRHILIGYWLKQNIAGLPEGREYWHIPLSRIGKWTGMRIQSIAETLKQPRKVGVISRTLQAEFGMTLTTELAEMRVVVHAKESLTLAE